MYEKFQNHKIVDETQERRWQIFSKRWQKGWQKFLTLKKGWQIFQKRWQIFAKYWDIIGIVRKSSIRELFANRFP